MILRQRDSTYKDSPSQATTTAQASARSRPCAVRMDRNRLWNRGRCAGGDRARDLSLEFRRRGEQEQDDGIHVALRFGRKVLR